MEISDILSADRILCDTKDNSKKSALETLAALIAGADHDLTQAEVFGGLLARERLGSTGLGHGVALPHGRLKPGDKTIAAFLRLRQGIDYDAPDQQGVDLLFALLVPENSTEEHLQILSKLATLFNDDTLCQRLRSASSEQSLFALLTG